MKPHDIFEANDLFENGNMTQVQTTLVALAGLVSVCIPGTGTNLHSRPDAPFLLVDTENSIQPVGGDRWTVLQVRDPAEVALEGCVLLHPSREGWEFRAMIPDCTWPCSGAVSPYTEPGRLTER